MSEPLTEEECEVIALELLSLANRALGCISSNQEYAHNLQSFAARVRALPSAIRAARDATTALQQIADMDPRGLRADDLGRAARVAREALGGAMKGKTP